MGKVNFKPGTMLSPMPIAMVSCGSNEEEYNIITVAWTGVVNSEPPMVYVSIRESRYSHDIIERDGEFVINLCTEKLVHAVDYCGVKSGRAVDKFKEQKLTMVMGESTGCPMIGESPVNIECKVKSIIKYPSHDMFVAEIVNVHVDANLIDENGKADLNKARLICYSHGEYYGLQREPLGRFGYSVMKPKTKKRLEDEKKRKSRQVFRKRSNK